MLVWMLVGFGDGGVFGVDDVGVKCCVFFVYRKFLFGFSFCLIKLWYCNLWFCI